MHRSGRGQGATGAEQGATTGAKRGAMGGEQSATGADLKARAGRAARSVAAFAAALGMSACASLGGGGPAPDIYDLTAPSAFEAVGGARTQAQLLVPVPTAISALATSRVVVRPSAAQIAYFPATTWSDELPALVQVKLIRAFENAGKARAVGRPGESLAIDFQVIVDIRAFELDLASGRTAYVALGVKLLDDRSGTVRASRVFEARVPAASDSPADAIAALDAAASQAFTAIVAWTASTL
ncbi:ABC-type transport auxiliary lipoprotein family protein [Mongoliimonas terrestris]|uniref:ABC-type transport auxiliary lipoprotein family protein n=1 Tax=Mongoliimonas terrestris TaxID=1709001 RepID=UPI000AA5BE2C|nr:ABC-type transport auxiliary lipoprotein family protein [Mongoliimonas terrestris]